MAIIVPMEKATSSTGLRAKLNYFFNATSLSDRVSRVHNNLSLGSTLLEISPNWAPLVTSEDLLPGGQIKYCDRMPTSWLRNREKDNPGRVKFDLEVMQSDFDWTPGKKLNECTDFKFDYVISSHVVEHVPDFLGHMIEVSSVLEPDGKYIFVIPNGRGTGEFFRRLSEESDVVEHFFMGGDRTSPGQNWDYLRNIIKYDGTSMYGKQKINFIRHHTDAEAIQDAARCFKEYVDVHSWVFDRQSFLSIITAFNQLKIFPFVVFDFQESDARTPDGEPFEFVVTLKKCDYSIPESWQEINLARSKENDNPSLSEKLIPGGDSGNLKSSISEKDKTISELSLQLLETQKNLDIILNSKSWKITKLLRRIRQISRY
jgi:SAM-dependent methyltransferase